MEGLEILARRGVGCQLTALLPLTAVAALGIDVLGRGGRDLKRKSQKQARQRVGEKRHEYDGLAILLDQDAALVPARGTMTSIRTPEADDSIVRSPRISRTRAFITLGPRCSASRSRSV